MKRFLVPAVASLLLLAGLVSGASAGEQWCDVDPAFLITTPGGNQVVIYLTSGALGLEHQVAVQTAPVTYTAEPVDGGRATLVHLTLTVPDDAFGSGFPTRTRASSGPWGTLVVYASTAGVSGLPMLLDFKVGLP